jgi:signal transduction histidine kinase
MMGFEIIAQKARDKKWLPALAVIGAIAVGYAFTNTFQGILQVINMILSGYGSNVLIPMGKQVLPMIVFSLIALLIYGIMWKKDSLQVASVRFADLTILVAGMFLGNLLKTDYSGFGVLTIAVIYGLRRNAFKSVLGGCITLTIMSFSEITAFLTLIPIRRYNGKRGLNLKYVFYAFYPVHLLILHTITYFMGIV